MSRLRRYGAARSVRRELRLAWTARPRRSVTLILDYRCMVAQVHGRVEHLATTDAYVIVDGWHIPLERITQVAVDQ